MYYIEELLLPSYLKNSSSDHDKQKISRFAKSPILPKSPCTDAAEPEWAITRAYDILCSIMLLAH